LPQRQRRPASRLCRKPEVPGRPELARLPQFIEYFHGDNGAGLGANHQTSWTGVIARAILLFPTLTPKTFLEGGKMAYFDSTKGSKGERIPAAKSQQKEIELLSEDHVNCLPLLIRQQVSVAADHFFSLVSHPFVYYPLVNSCRCAVRRKTMP
jgi:hypothetical protein